MSQTAHTQDPAEAFEGMEADNSAVKERISGQADVIIPFGRFVSADGTQDSPHTVELPDATAKVTDGRGLGIAVADVSHQEGPTLGVNQYAVNDAVPVLRRGRIHVISEDVIAVVGAQAFVRFNAGNLGAFRGDVAGGDAVALPGARFLTVTTAINQLAVLEFFAQT